MTQDISVDDDTAVKDVIVNPIQMLRIYDLEHSVGYKKSTIDLSQNTDLLSFLIKVTQETMNSGSSRAYQFNEGSYINGQLKTIESDIDTIATNIADHLFLAEEASNFQTSNGSFILAKIKTENRYCYILSKLDFKRYFEEKTYKLKSGLPEENAILKSCLINIKEDDSFDKKIFLADKNGTIAYFWHTDFLDSSPERNNEVNTKEVYDTIGRLLTSKVKKVSKDDFHVLKDCVNSYFKTKETFNFDDFIKNTIESYSPIDEKFKVDDFINSLKEEKESIGFDGTFEIDKKYINKKIKETIDVYDGVKLIIQGKTSDIIFEVEYENKDYLLIENTSKKGRFTKKELE